MNNDIEEYLGSFKLLEPPDKLREHVLGPSRRYWKERTERQTPFVLAAKIFFPAAAFLLISALAFDQFVVTRNENDVRKYESIASKLTELGIPGKAAVLMAAFKEEKRQGWKTFEKVKITEEY